RQRRHRKCGRSQGDRRGHQPIGNSRGAEQGLRHWGEHKERDKQADTAVSDQGAGQYDREYRALRSQLFRHKIGNRRDGTTVLHQLAKQGPKQEQRKKLRDKSRPAVHESLRPVGEYWPSGERGGDKRRPGSEQQDAPAAIREPDEEREAEQDTKQSHRLTRSSAVR